MDALAFLDVLDNYHFFCDKVVCDIYFVLSVQTQRQFYWLELNALT